MKADSIGRAKEVTMDDLVEIGVFAAARDGEVRGRVALPAETPNPERKADYQSYGSTSPGECGNRPLSQADRMESG